MCHSELGPATEYGCLLTNPAGNLLRPPNGSMDLRVLRTRSLVTFTPLARRLPQIICTPEYGQSCLICWTCDMRSSSLISFSGSCNRPYSSLRLCGYTVRKLNYTTTCSIQSYHAILNTIVNTHLNIVILLTHKRAAMSVHLNDKDARYNN